MKLLLRIGICTRRLDGSIRWPVKIAPAWIWKSRRAIIGTARLHDPVYVFRNKPGSIKWVPGRMLPRRWGIGFFGLIEFGDRGC